MANIDRFSIVTLIIFFLSTIFVIQPIYILTKLPFFGRQRIAIDLKTAPILAIAILWASQCLGPDQIRSGIVGTDGVKPYNILVSFFFLAYMVMTLEVTGVLQAAAFWVDNRGGSNGRKLYLYIYIMLTLITMIFGNEFAILSGTVFLIHYTAVTMQDPIAWLMSGFAAANSASMVFGVGNPTNVIICEGFRIDNAAFTAYTILPFVACSTFSFITLAFQFRKENFLPQKLIRDTRYDVRKALRDPIGALVGSIILGSCLVLVLVLSFLHIDMWKIVLPFASAKFIFDISWDHFRFITGRLAELEARSLTTNVVGAEYRVHRAITIPYTLLRTMIFPPKNRTPSINSDTNSSLYTLQGVQSPDLKADEPIEVPVIQETYSPEKREALALHFPTFFTVLPRLPFRLILFVFAKLVLIEALTRHGWIEVFGRWLVIATSGQMFPVIWIVGIVGVVLCNIFGTNIGATILLTKIIHQANLDGPAQIGAAIALAVASNIGAVNLINSASLAGLLWDTALRQKGILVRQWTFARWNVLPLMVMTGVGLGIVCAEMAVLY